MEPDKSLNMTGVEDDSKFLDWDRNLKLDIGTRSYDLWKGARFWPSLDPSLGLN